MIGKSRAQSKDDREQSSEPVPQMAGVEIGTIENKGIELSADVTPVKTDSFEWNIGGNVTFQDSKITKLTTVLDNTPGINTGGYEGATGNTIQNHQVGYAPSSFFVYEQVYDEEGLGKRQSLEEINDIA